VHGLANAYFLWISGRDLEARFGPARLLGLLLVSTLAGWAAHAASVGAGGVPCVGASGGISGLFGYYAFAFPRSRIGITLHGWRWRTSRAVQLRIGVPWVFGGWMLVQLLLADGARGRVAYEAHLGGAVAGVACWFAGRLLGGTTTVLRSASPPGESR
jgi:membrane associated rhomboid family serine protease